mmetsp:Transcript_7943/g.14446  ORF Transcript_7943/g.14446 Transcript_7943/m.14446 type:complete len:182 (-) Transcript_7943:276-821(-)|eukprot:CAMPEP_0202496722 /NCGR_PEP_ID=MMETSP1361-20130828/20763_1 /ASSEMBLY_ACC=CAM_ASM_000849 /TAXON_ID=210615 /ORGANISM="Staurosira complex sp., Strain CCMP2646" /LENGTH=181 /DNA_ID=CAMNT_0049128125 /DNA_START=105 /DNA_END=650 /DNA_ORIENTATION=-
MSESSSEPMLVVALRNITRELPGLLYSLYVFAWDVLTAVVFPLASICAVTIVSWKIGSEGYKILFPPPADVWHKEALGVLKKGEDDLTIRKAERLLKKSIHRQPTYLPSHLSIASLQLYQKDSPQECLKSIDYALTIFPNNEQLIQLQLDAKAVQGNMKNMVTAGAVTVPYLGEIPFRQRK